MAGGLVHLPGVVGPGECAVEQAYGPLQFRLIHTKPIIRFAFPDKPFAARSPGRFGAGPRICARQNCDMTAILRRQPIHAG
jgi:hypothetical protein